MEFQTLRKVNKDAEARKNASFKWFREFAKFEAPSCQIWILKSEAVLELVAV